MDISFADRLNISGYACLNERRYGSDALKRKLRELEAIEKRLQAARSEFNQLAIASRLRSEFDPGVCESDRRKPVQCRFRWRQLSNGRDLKVELTNRMPSVPLIDWMIIVQITPLVSINNTRGHWRNSSWSSVHHFDRLDPGETKQFRTFHEHGPGDYSTFTRPSVLRCLLARYFRRGDWDQPKVTLTFLIGTEFAGTDGLVCDRSRPTFGLVSTSTPDIDQVDVVDVGEFKFCITESLLHLLFPDATAVDKRFMEWLFPQVRDWNWPQQSIANERSSKSVPTTLQSPILTMGCNAKIECSVQYRSKTDDYLIKLELSCFREESERLLVNLKMAIWIRLMLAIHKLRKYPTRVIMDRRILAKAKEKLGNIDLDEFLDVNIPFAFSIRIDHLMATGNKAAFQSQMAFVIGFTGEVGKELIKELLERKVFQKLILIGRRQVPLEGELYKNAEQKIVDFDNLDQHKAAFQDCTVGFCCLGTTQGKSGNAGFVKVDHDYVVSMAKLAREQGCQHFSVISSVGANKDSLFLYPKTKGLMEQHVAEVDFPRLTFFRPGLLLCDREGTGFGERLGERLFGTLTKPITWAKPTWISVPTNTVAKAMIADLWRKTDKKVDIIDNAGIHQVAKEV